MPFSVKSFHLSFMDGLCCGDREEQEKAEKREQLNTFLKQYNFTDDFKKDQSVTRSLNSFTKSPSIR